MSITLVLRGAHESSAKLTLEGPRIVLGRGQSSDVRIPDSTVSNRHASIRHEGGQYVLVDEGSANGTWVGEVRLTRGATRVLRQGDWMRLGRVWIEVQFDAAVPTAELAGATRDVAFALVEQALVAMGSDTTTRILVVEGIDTGSVLHLEDDGRSYVVGRGDDCDLQLEDPDASRRHLLLCRRGRQVFAQDLGSKNGATLGENPLTPGRDVAWRGRTELKLARTVLALEEPVARALLDIEGEAERPLTAEELAEPPPNAEPPAAEESEPLREPQPASPAAAAPIAALPPPSSGLPQVPARKKPRFLSSADLAIAAMAVLVLAVSLVALLALLRS